MQDQCIEILLASYNGSLYICEQIDSILNQTDTNWLLTISDDGSTDGTNTILDEYIRYHPEKNQAHMLLKTVWRSKTEFYMADSKLQCDLYCLQRSR